MTGRAHPGSDAARAAALRATPETLQAMFDAAQSDREQFGPEYGNAAFEQLAAVAIARVILDTEARSAPVADVPAVLADRIARDRGRSLRAVPDPRRDELAARSRLYPEARTIEIFPGGAS